MLCIRKGAPMLTLSNQGLMSTLKSSDLDVTQLLPLKVFSAGEGMSRICCLYIELMNYV